MKIGFFSLHPLVYRFIFGSPRIIPRADVLTAIAAIDPQPHWNSHLKGRDVPGIVCHVGNASSEVYISRSFKSAGWTGSNTGDFAVFGSAEIFFILRVIGFELLINQNGG